MKREETFETRQKLDVTWPDGSRPCGRFYFVCHYYVRRGGRRFVKVACAQGDHHFELEVDEFRRDGGKIELPVQGMTSEDCKTISARRIVEAVYAKEIARYRELNLTNRTPEENEEFLALVKYLGTATLNLIVA